MKNVLFLLLTLPLTQRLQSQQNCTFKQPSVTIHFGNGNIDDLNKEAQYNYSRVTNYCPTDGHYSYTSYTSDCFRADWFSLSEDHTANDVDGNMMIVNASNYSGPFLTTTINGLKGGTTYEFGAWLMNVCKISEKCPFPLLPVITVKLQTITGKIVAEFNTGEVIRRLSPEWKQYRAVFTTPNTQTPLILTMGDNSPGGCGNDFALDDITFRECIKSKPPPTPLPKAPAVVKKAPAVPQPILRKAIPKPVERQTQPQPTVKQRTELPAPATPLIRERTLSLPTRPPVLTTRANPLIKQIETETGEIRLDLYDNGDVDGDTVTIYHNNVLMVSNARLSQKPITFRIVIDPANPRHEFIMVANNLGSIPPNTSMMVITTATKRYEVFISSNEEKNAKVVLQLKE